MTDIRFFCPECKVRLTVEDQVAGYTVACPTCGAQIAIPTQSDPSMGPPPRQTTPIDGTLTKEEAEFLSREE